MNCLVLFFVLDLLSFTHFKVATSGAIASLRFPFEAREKDQWQKDGRQKINAFAYIFAIHFFAIDAFEPSPKRFACRCARGRPLLVPR